MTKKNKKELQEQIEEEIPEKTIRINTFWYWANFFRKKMTTDEELEKIDWSEKFWTELKKIALSGELLNMNINGRVRLGKSTLAMVIATKYFEYMKLKWDLIPTKTQFGIKNIARDQQEFSKMMRADDLHHTVVVTDEWNDLEEGGENSSVEKQLQESFSKIHAVRQVNRISCSPSDQVDTQSNIILEVIGADKKRKITHCKLYYMVSNGVAMYPQLLGFININVSKIIKNWEQKVYPIFQIPEKERTTEQKKKIEYWSKKDYYVLYMVKKSEKLQLITKYGIFRPRLLDYAETIIEVELKLRKLSKRQTILNKEIIKNFCKQALKKRKIPHSIVGLELITNEVKAILDLWKSHAKTKKDLQITNKRFKKGQIPANEYEQEKIELQETIIQLQEAIIEQLNELEKYKQVNEKYNENIKRFE